MRILFITSNRLGDAVLSTGLVVALARRWPGARFTIACGPVPAPLFDALPGCERVIIMRKQRLLRHWLGLLGACIGTWWHMVVDVRGSATAWLLPTARRRAFRRPDDDRHRVEQLSAWLGLPRPAAPCLWAGPQHLAAADRLVDPAGPPVLAVGPTANWMPKTWPADRFAALVGRLTGGTGPLAGARVLVAGAPGEAAAAAPVLRAIPAGRRIDLVGTADLVTLGVCLGRAALYVGNDSGLMHLAAAAGAPTLGLFGPSRPEHYRPWGPRGAFVRTLESAAAGGALPVRPDPAQSLMTGLTVETVAEAACRLLRHPGPGARAGSACGPDAPATE